MFQKYVPDHFSPPTINDFSFQSSVSKIRGCFHVMKAIQKHKEVLTGIFLPVALRDPNMIYPNVKILSSFTWLSSCFQTFPNMFLDGDLLSSVEHDILKNVLAVFVHTMKVRALMTVLIWLNICVHHTKWVCHFRRLGIPVESYGLFSLPYVLFGA